MRSPHWPESVRGTQSAATVKLARGNVNPQLLIAGLTEELRRQAGAQDEAVAFHHFRDKDGAEVDVVIERGGRVEHGAHHAGDLVDRLPLQPQGKKPPHAARIPVIGKGGKGCPYGGSRDLL